MNKNNEAACFSYSEKQAAFLRLGSVQKFFEKFFKAESPNDLSLWEQVKGLVSIPDMECLSNTYTERFI